MPWGHATTDRPERWIGAFATAAEAIADGRRTHGGATFWICFGTIPDVSTLIPDADEIIERMGERAYDQAREAAEEWPDIGRESAARAELDAFLLDWAKRYAPVNFWIATEHKEKIEPEKDDA